MPTKKQILVPIDFSALHESIVARAAHLARSWDAELTLLYCAAPIELSVVAVEAVYLPAPVMERFTGEHITTVAGKLDKIAKELPPGHKVRTRVKATTAVEGILAVAEELHCDAIVMGSHGAGFDRFLLGSTAEAVTRAAPCPVVIVRDDESPKPFHRVVVGIDFSLCSAPLVELARELVDGDGEIHLLHCWQPPHLDTAHLFGDPGHADLVSVLSDGMGQHADELERFTQLLPADERYRLHVETGRPAAVLIKEAETLQADAVLVGAHNEESVQSLLGSVSDRVLRHARTTVVLTEKARDRALALQL